MFDGIDSFALLLGVLEPASFEEDSQPICLMSRTAHIASKLEPLTKQVTHSVKTSTVTVMIGVYVCGLGLSNIDQWLIHGSAF